MDGYSYRFLDEQGSVGATLLLHSESDESARDLASELLSRSQFPLVEVRRGVSIICQIRRERHQASGR
jgi:hypothetical protein